MKCFFFSYLNKNYFIYFILIFVFIPLNYIPQLFDGVDAAELFITSGATFTTEDAPPEAFTLEEIRGIAVVSKLALGDKCERCYQLSEEVGSNKDHPNVCNRCADAAEHFQPLNEST